MDKEAAHAQLTDAILWIGRTLDPLELSFGQRRHLVFACYDLAIEHMAAVDVLYRSGLTGSMLALLRSLFESVVRGMWLDRCASEQQLEQFRCHKLNLAFGVLIKQIEATFTSGNQSLSSIQSKVWAALNGYTHTGYNQVVGRHGEGTLGAAYSESEIVSALRLAAMLGLVAAGQLAEAADKTDAVAEAAVLLRALK